MTAAPGEKLIVVKNWHITLILVGWFLTAFWNYAGLNARADETARRVKDLEDHRLTKEQFQEFRDDLFRQLNDWEKKVELERSIQQLASPH